MQETPQNHQTVANTAEKQQPIKRNDCFKSNLTTRRAQSQQSFQHNQLRVPSAKRWRKQNRVSVGLTYIESQGNITATIIWFHHHLVDVNVWKIPFRIEEKEADQYAREFLREYS